jgi:hypothetical protein
LPQQIPPMKLLKTAWLLATYTAASSCLATAAPQTGGAAKSAQKEIFSGFSWDRVPLNIHFGKRTAVSDAELDFLAATTQFVTLEKGQGVETFGSTEAGTLDSARRLKHPEVDAVDRRGCALS